jgi:hypothetical protein
MKGDHHIEFIINNERTFLADGKMSRSELPKKANYIVLNRKARRRARKLQKTFELDGLWYPHASPAVTAVIGKENLNTAVQSLVNEALKCLNGARLPITNPEQVRSLGCTMRLPMTDDNGSSLDLGFMFDFASGKVAVLFPHEAPRVFASMASGDVEIYIPEVKDVNTSRLEA